MLNYQISRKCDIMNDILSKYMIEFMAKVSIGVFYNIFEIMIDAINLILYFICYSFYQDFFLSIIKSK